MNIFNENVVPYKGLEHFKLMSSLSDIKDYLKRNRIPYMEEYQANQGCNPDVPWLLLRINNCIALFFAREKLWEIYLEEGFEGVLPNGIRIGTDLNEAKSIDKTLKYNDWNEDYESGQGYWLEDDLNNGKIMSISVFIKEVEDDDVFFSYHWAEKVE